MKAKVTLASVLLVVIAGCSFFGIQNPVTFEERVAFVQSTVDEAQKGLKEHILANDISKADATDVDKQLDVAIESLDVTIAVRETDPARAENRLEAAQVIVDALKKLAEK